ncbi:hypothetical protein XELAEV_18007737mg [Xenopus laevis]|uniref:Uncharacterized protein n=1 Tax=Xenopus laevis TaxID=8355 RepID=A0A974I5P3_XENLA|nr:hypothetical protein XELAEV_18007737mg [Xenopus laevis]
MDELKSRIRFYSDEENEFPNDSSCACIEVTGHCTSLWKQINECYRELVYDSDGTMEILDVDEQAKAYDSGVYAVANAFEFLFGRNPICKYDHKKMRRHLIRCFNRRTFTALTKKTDACVVDLEPKLNFTWLNRK